MKEEVSDAEENLGAEEPMGSKKTSDASNIKNDEKGNPGAEN